MKPKIYIRTDGDSDMGLGHVVRCIALAQMLQNAYSICFFCRHITNKLEEEISALGSKLYRIENEEEFTDNLSSGSIVVLDGYHFNSVYQQFLKDKGVILICIDDLHDKTFVTDLVINHTPGISPTDYQAAPYTYFALGPEYALLRSRFLKQASKKREITKIDTVLICFGGSDHKNLTLSTLQTVVGFKEFKKIILITGSAYLQLSTLLVEVEKYDHVDHYHAIGEDDMLCLMQLADVAIVPASGLLLEAIACNLIIVSGIYIDNQKWLYEKYKSANTFIDGGSFGESELKRAIITLFQSKYNRKLQTIDGLSGQRIRKVVEQVSKLNSFALRRAIHDDLLKTFQWATDETVRGYSFNQHKISLEEHTQWFQVRLADKYCIYLIADDRFHRSLGSIRFDIENSEAKVSYLIDPLFQGQGLGTALLAKGIAYLNKLNREDTCRVVGYVKKENIASLKAFSRLGFSSIDEDVCQVKFVKHIR